MIALSSYAPMARSPEVARNQIAAKRSWDRQFNRIIYFNDVEISLLSPQTGFTGHGTRPNILEMAAYAATFDESWVAIINADIVVSGSIEQFEQRLDEEAVWCGISRRLQFDPATGLRNGKLVDLGLDFFFARPSIWALVSSEIPEQFVIGKQLWDTWVLSFFLVHSGQKCVDATPCGLVWHPKHNSRGDFAMEPPPGDTYLDRVSWPQRKFHL